MKPCVPLQPPLFIPREEAQEVMVVIANRATAIITNVLFILWYLNLEISLMNEKGTNDHQVIQRRRIKILLKGEIFGRIG